MLFKTSRTLCLCAVLISMQSCTQIDDYMLGKDNTPVPASLKAITPKMTFVEKWSVYTGNIGKGMDELKIAPVVNGELIYTASSDGTLQATRKANGEIAWVKRLPHALISGPSVGQGHIAVSTNASSINVLNQANGELLWEAKLSGDALAKPLIVGREVIVKTIDGNLYAYDLKKGEKLWMDDHGSPHLILKASSAPVLFDKLVLAGFSDGKLDAVEKQTGRLVWQRNIAYATGASDVERMVDIDADPIVHGDNVYLATYQGYIGALSLENGQFIWQQPASIYKNMVISGDTIYYVDSESTVWARNRTNGHVKWKQETLKARGLTEPVLFKNHLMIGDKSGYLHGLSLSTGELISRTQVNSPMLTAPVVEGDSVFVLTANGRLTRYTYRVTIAG